MNELEGGNNKNRKNEVKEVTLSCAIPIERHIVLEGAACRRPPDGAVALPGCLIETVDHLLFVSSFLLSVSAGVHLGFIYYAFGISIWISKVKNINADIIYY